MSGAPLTPAQAAQRRDEVAQQARKLAAKHSAGRYAPPAGAVARARWATLTPCEARIAVMVAYGLPVKVVASVVSIAPSTVSDHLRYVRSKLCAYNAAQVCMVLGRAGVL